jgi:hypothetical protein
MGLLRDTIRVFKQDVQGTKERKFRLLMYSAYNAMGLIGSECNGIAVLDEDKLLVLADELYKAGSGYEMPTPEQLTAYEYMAGEMTWPEFQALINNSKRKRYTI